VREEPVLGLLRVLVHDVSHNREVEVAVSLGETLVDEDVSLAVAVREHNHHHVVYQLHSVSLRCYFKDIWSEGLGHELLH